MIGRCLPVVMIAAVVFAVSVSAADAQAPANPNTVLIESREPGAAGKRIELKQFTYIGSPTISRDGESVAFDAYSSGFQGDTPTCWTVRTDGTGLRKICNGATPRWSPDGKQLVFMRERERDRNLGLGIFTINSDGSDERRITDGRWPDWSPDGKKIVYAVGGEERHGGARTLARICVADADGANVEEVAIGDCPSWSMDGKKIACCFADPAIPVPIIRIVDVRTGEQSFAGSGWFRPNWSADGKSVYANGISERGERGIFRFPAERGQKPERIFQNVSGAESPAESWDGKRVVFVAPAGN